MGNFALLQALAFEPRKAFAELDARPRYWWPLLVLVFAQAGVVLWYLNFVDLEWLVDLQIRASAAGRNMTDAEVARTAQMASANPGAQKVFGTLLSGLAVAFFMLLGALYYALAGKITGIERGLRHWMALSAWSSMPALLGLVAACIMMATAGSNQIGQEALQPLSLNALFFHREAGEPGYALFSSANLFQVAALALAAIGVRVWARRSWPFSIVFVSLPYVLAYGIWAFFALR